MERWHKWCQVDANLDLVYLDGGIPLSVGELHAGGERLAGRAVAGPAFEDVADWLRQFAREHLLTGEAFRLWAVWPRSDFFGHPECTPPAHGMGAYSEADWVWATAGRPEELGMFPYHADAATLGRQPEGWE